MLIHAFDHYSAIITRFIEKGSQHFGGRVAGTLCMLMYVAYIPEIILNLKGQPVPVIQPFVAMICAFSWVCYGYFREVKDWPMILSNIPGIILGGLTVITVYIN